MVKKVKPLYRLSELETAAYAFLRGIDYVVEECPLVAGNTQLRYKEAHERDRDHLAGHQGAVLPGLPRPREAAVPRRPTPPTSSRANDAISPPRGGSAPSAAPGPRSSANAWTRRPSADREVAAELSDEVLPAEIYGGAG